MRSLFIAILVIIAFVGRAQEDQACQLFTDRDIYASGEYILIKVFTSDKMPSQVVHLDLVNTKGKILSGISKLLAEQQTDGYIYIPDSLRTDTYLLCASFRGNPNIIGKELLVCNRFSGLSEIASIPRLKEKEPVNTTSSELQIEGLKKFYQSRDTARITLSLSPDLLTQAKDAMSVTISRSVPGYKSKTFSGTIAIRQNQATEQDGVLIEGIARDMETGLPFKNGCIYLSVADSVPKLSYCLTREDGYFNFQLRGSRGTIPAVIQGYDLQKKRQLTIELARPDSLTDAVPVLTSWQVEPEMIQEIRELTETTSIRKIFDDTELKMHSARNPNGKDYPFYGIANDVVRPDLFIDLPDFTEVSRELLPRVKFRAYNRIPTMHIFNPLIYNYFNEEPLVLLDGIPVQDLNLIKNLGSNEMKKIEICTTERFYGDLSFHGVVAIYSAKPDINRFTESKYLIIRNINTVQSDFSLNVPSRIPPNEPDLREVLLWEPSVKPGQNINLSFATSDLHGHFTLSIHVKSKSGKIFHNEQTFEVH